MQENQRLKNKEIIFRKVKKSDLDSIMEIEVVSFSLPWTKSSYEEMMQLDNACFIVAEHNSEVIGYMLYQFWPDGAELHAFAVKPECRKQGVGKLMFDELFQLSKKQNIKAMFLQVRPSNKWALRLYKKVGFVIVGHRKNYYTDDGEDANIMAARIE